MGLINGITDFLGLTNESGQEEAMKNAIAQFTGINAPKLDPIQLQQLVSAGTLTPEAASTIQQAQSQMANIQTNPQTLQAQQGALNQLQQLGAQGGMSAQDQALQFQLQSDAAQKAKSGREAVMQNAAQRGIGGSGLEMLGQMQAEQGGANANAANQYQINAGAQQRALQAMQGAGQLGGQMQAQQFGQQSAQAQAQDAINRYNAMNSQSLGNMNVNARNNAQNYNLTNAQNIGNTNVGLQNQQQMYNKVTLPQQQFANQMALASGRAGAYQGLGNAYGSQAAQTAQGVKTAGEIGSGIGQGYNTAKTMFGAEGGRIPGEQHYNNNYANDTVPVMAQGGEIMIPNADSHNRMRAHAFVDKVMDKSKDGTIDHNAFLDHITGYKFKMPEES
jgi:hypothetical protein